MNVEFNQVDNEAGKMEFLRCLPYSHSVKYTYKLYQTPPTSIQSLT